MPTAATDDDDDLNFENGDLNSSRTVLTEAGEGYARIKDGQNQEESPNSIVNADAMYENTTFRGMCVIGILEVGILAVGSSSCCHQMLYNTSNSFLLQRGTEKSQSLWLSSPLTWSSSTWERTSIQNTWYESS